jgi:hypothetical protein
MLPVENNPAVAAWLQKSEVIISLTEKFIGCKVKHNRLIYNGFYGVYIGSVEGLYVVFGYTFRFFHFRVPYV